MSNRFTVGKNLLSVLAVSSTLIGGGILWQHHAKDTLLTQKEQIVSQEKTLTYAEVQALYERYRGMSAVEYNAIPKKDRPDLAILQDFLRTANPHTGTIPLSALSKANRDTRQNLRNARTEASISNVEWTERGPNNVGGRTRALMYDPNDVDHKKVWAGSVGGGLWYTDDITAATPTWNAVDGFWANIAVSSIAYDPTNTDVFYVGTGEGWFNADAIRGDGIWKTEDGGNTWEVLTSTQSGSTSDFLYIQKLVVTSEGTVLVTTRNPNYISTDANSGGIFRSDDGGATWEKVTLPEQSTRGADLEVAANGDIYATTSVFGSVVGSIYKSTDDGLNWSEITPSNISTSTRRIEVACAPSDASTIYAIGSNGSDVSFFKKSVDGGSNWSDVTIPMYYNQDCTVSTQDFTRGQSWYDLILAVNPDDANEVLAGGIDVHRSQDGGSTWSPISYWTGSCFEYVHADIHALEYKPNSDELLVGCDGGVFRTPDVSATTPDFTERNNGYNVTQFYSAAIHPTANTNYFLAGAQDNGSHAFSGAGVVSTTEVTGGDGAFAFIDQDNPDIQITSYVYNKWFVSTNGGSSFNNLGAGENTGDFINVADYDDTNNFLFSSVAGTSGGNDIGRWSVPSGSKTNLSISNIAATGESATHIKVSPFTTSGSTTLFVGSSSGEVIKVTGANSGTNPTNSVISNTTMHSQGSVSCIEVGESENELIVTYSNYGVQSVWYTSDGGNNWTSLDNGHGLPDMPIRWALFNPNNTNQVLLATETGIWSSDNITASASTTFWEASSTGLANVRCDMLQVRSSDNLVAVGTHGRGLFTSDVFMQVIADFSASATVTYLNKNITFTDASSLVTSWDWDFGSGASIASAATEGPHTVSYSTAGLKTVELSINEGAATKTISILVLPDEEAPYGLANGGNFEDGANENDFGASTGNSIDWERGNSAVSGKNGVSSGSDAWVTGLEDAQYPNSVSGIYLMTPNFDLSGGCNYSLSFKTKFSTEDTYDGFIVEYSLDKGDTWTKLDPGNFYNNTTANDADESLFGLGQSFFSGTQSSYVTKTANLIALAGEESVAFRFSFKSDTYEQGVGVAIDDFEITEDCTPTIALENISTTTYCAGETISIPYITTGTFEDGNSFTAQLSDASGSFASPIATASGNSPISLVIPASAATSSAYKVRVIGSSPATISDEEVITINEGPANVVLESDNGENSICFGTTVNFTVDASNQNETGTTYQFFVNGESQGTASTTKTFSSSELVNGDEVYAVVTTPLVLNYASVTNNSGITINDNAAASPNPSTITVSDLSGAITNVTVTLTGLTHTFPKDLDILLQSPNGDNLILMSDCGSINSEGIDNESYVFSDAASGRMATSSDNASGTYKPTNSGSPDTFTSLGSVSAGTGVNSATFASVFAGDAPNGTWKLYIQEDDAFDDTGSITSWSISITTDATANAACPLTTNIITISGNSSIMDLVAGEQTACVNGVYTQEVELTYENPDEATEISVNGQLFEVTGSPQTVILTDLTADNEPVSVTAFFVGIEDCAYTEAELFTAPEPCTLVCSISDISAGTQSSCSNNAYSQEIIVMYENAPETGNLVVNGQSFAITSSPQTVTLTNLTANGNSVDVTAHFSENESCSLSENAAFTAPAPCGYGNLYVNATTGNDTNDGLTAGLPKQTIQAAVNIAAEGANLYISAGTYNETVTVEDDLTIIASGSPAVTKLVMNAGDGILNFDNTSSEFVINEALELQAGNVNSNGKIVLNSTASQTAIIDDFSAGFAGTISGSVTAKRYLQYKNWYYVGAPVFGSTFIGAAGSGTYCIKKFNEGSHVWACASGALETMRGYWLYNGTAGVTRQISGTVNTGTKTYNLTRNLYGTNVISNPYPSPINWVAVANLASNAGKFDGFARFKPVLTSGNAGTTLGSATISSAGVATNTDDAIIPSLQGFFVGITNIYSGFTFTMDNSVRVTSNNTNFMRQEKEWSELVKLSLQDANGNRDETAVHAHPKATHEIDFYDADNNTNNELALYSIWKNIRYTINAMPALGQSETRQIALGIKTPTAGKFKINAKQIVDFAHDVEVVLEDKVMGTFQNLQENATYEFTTAAGTNEGRFILHINKKEDMQSIKNAVHIYSVNAQVYIDFSKLSDVRGEITILDMLGRPIKSFQRQGEKLVVLPIETASGVYVVKIKTENGSYSKQVFVGK